MIREKIGVNGEGEPAEVVADCLGLRVIVSDTRDVAAYLSIEQVERLREILASVTFSERDGWELPQEDYMHVVCYKVDGVRERSRPMSYAEAVSQVNYLNAKYPGIEHWIEKVE